MKRPVAIELFAGAGGLSIGLQKAGFELILANEIQADFVKTLRLNHPETKIVQADIHSLDFYKEIHDLGYRTGDIDLLSGGPPCQGFSTVGSKNERDPRNSLFYEYIRAIKEVRPKYAIFENVSGFKRLYSGKAYSTLVEEFAALGYEMTGALLDASDFGLPQKRIRTIIVAWRTDQKAVSIPEPTHFEYLTLFNNKIKRTLMDAVSDLPEIGTGEESDTYKCDPQNTYQASLRGGCNILTEHTVANYGAKMQKILGLIPAGGSVQDLPQALRPKSYFANTYARLLPDVPSPTITRNFGTPSSSRCVHPFQNRALSTREGARLQGFPDNYIFYGSKGSKNLQIGNAVPPIFGQVIAENIRDSLFGSPFVTMEIVGCG